MGADAGIARRLPRSPVGSFSVTTSVESSGVVETGDRVGVARRELVEPLDRRVVERVPAHVARAARLALQRTHDVLRRHRHVLQRRAVLDAVLQGERPRQPVVGHDRHLGRQVGAELAPTRVRRLPVVREQRAEQAAAEVLPRDRRVLLLRIERVLHVADQRDVQRASRLGARRSIGRLRRGTAGVPASTCDADARPSPSPAR